MERMQTRVPFVWFSELSRFSMILFCNNIEQSNDALIIYVFFFRTMVVHITLNIFFPHNEGLNISNNVFVLTLAWYFTEWGRFWLQHPTNRASSFCLFEWGGEKEALPESRQTFEVTATQTSEQINLLSNRVIRVRVRAIWETDGHNRASCSKCSAIIPKLFPSKIPRMLNKDLVWFMQSLSETSFFSPCEQSLPLSSWVRRGNGGST